MVLRISRLLFFLFWLMKTHFLLISVFVVLVTCCSCHKNNVREEVNPYETATCMVRFEKDGAKEFFNIAVKDEYKKDVWYVFRLNHYCDHSELQYMDLWRIDWGYRGRFDPVTRIMTNELDKILTNGENESVFKDYGENLNVQGQPHVDTYDFTGGYHGDERIDLGEDHGVAFYSGDKELTADDITRSFDWTVCDGFRYVQKSSMHKTALKVDGKAQLSDHHVVAEHIKETVFENGGYRTTNRLSMRDAIDFYWYFGICCVGRSVAEKGCNEDMKTVSFDAAGGNKLEEVGKKEYHAWYDAHSIEVYVSSTVTAGGDDSLAKMHIWDNQNYAKYYRRYPAYGAHRTSDGEEFASEMTVKFSSR